MVSSFVVNGDVIVSLPIGGSMQHFIDGDGQATSSKTFEHISVAKEYMHTPGQSLD